MKKILKKDIALSPMIILPFILLRIAWNDIPNQLFIRWQGITRLEPKYMLLYPCLLPLLSYLILLIPALMPTLGIRKRIIENRKSYFNLKCAIVLFLVCFDWLLFWWFKMDRIPPVLPGY